MFAALFGFGSLVAGCGGGGGSSAPPVVVPNPTGSQSLVSGAVTDVNGNGIVGATVTLNGQTATSTAEGVYTIPNVLVPAGQSSLVGTIQATKTIAGAPWSGQNMVEVLSGERDTSRIHIVISPSATQNAITGTVTDTAGHVLRGARVFASNGPFTNSTTGDVFFSNLSSIATTTDQNGAYTLAHLPPGSTYTVTASFAGFLNQTLSNVAVNPPPASPTVQPFSLAASTTSSTPPAVQLLSATAFTTPSAPNRSVNGTLSSRAFDAIKAWILARKGIHQTHIAAASRVTLKRSAGRDTPAGSIIEANLFWKYENINNLFGYEVAQATSLIQANFTSIALIRDPLADGFSDVDTSLTPDTTYYYSVARLDTINFPNGNVTAGEGPPPETPAVVQPLRPIGLTAPPSGSVTTAAPTFSWTAVNRAALYQILVYDRYPDLPTFSSTPDGVQPIWPADSNVPGTSQVSAPATSQAYQGPALVSGHTYYWTVIAQDDTGTDFSLSPIQSFIAP